MPDFVLSSLRGGLNTTDPPTHLRDDQCVEATNVEWITSTLGERRQGADNISLTGATALAAETEVVFLHRHLPTNDETAAELWAFGTTGTATSSLFRKTTAWQTELTFTDAVVLTGGAKYQLSAVSLHGKLFLAYDSTQDRLHVCTDGANVRRTGLAEPAAPTVAEQGAGTFSGIRYYRVRYTVQSGGVTLRRSEPSDVTTYDPAGGGSNGASARVTKPITISEDETHWEVEASVDNSNFYVIATTAVGTTFVDDSQVYASGYADDFDLAPDVGDYTLIPSGKILLADRDRLIILGSWEDTALSSRVAWTPVLKDTGAGNDERLESDQDPFVDLDPLNGGEIMDGWAANGTIWVFKWSHIYKLVASGVRSRAYDVTPISKVRGALPGSVVEGVDDAGQPAIYFLDPEVGPCRINIAGVRQCGRDIWTTWLTVNKDASVVARAEYYPEHRQVHFFVATSSNDTPDTRLVLHVNETRLTEDGDVRGGWAVWTGESCEALATCLFSTNIDDGAARNRTLVPFIGRSGSGLIWRTDTGTDDNGTAYAAALESKPFVRGNLLTQFEARGAVVVGKAVENAAIDVSVVRDFGKETDTAADVSFTPEGEETQVVAPLDQLGLSEMHAMSVRFEDVDDPVARWELSLFAMRDSGGAKA